MVGVTNIQINESKAELEALLQKSQSLKDKERLQVLYLLKAKELKVQEVAHVVGKHRGTIHRWLSKYSQGGIDSLLSFRYSPGRKSKLPLWAKKALEKQLQQPQGFKSYRQIQQWLSESLGLEVEYFKYVDSFIFLVNVLNLKEKAKKKECDRNIADYPSIFIPIDGLIKNEIITI